MSQADPNVFVDTESGTAHVSRHNSVGAALLTMHSGASRPAYAVDGTQWLDSDTPSATVQTIKLYDGAGDIGLMTVDFTNDYVAKFGVGIQPSAMAAGTLLHVKNGASGATAATDADDAVVESSAGVGQSWLGSNAGGVKLTLGTASLNEGFGLAWSYTSNIGYLQTNRASAVVAIRASTGNEVMRFDGQKAMMNDTVDGDTTIGLTINQLTNDNFLLTGKSSDVVHGMSGIIETDTFFGIKKFDANVGGMYVQTFTEDTQSFVVAASQSNSNSSHNTSGTAAIQFRSLIKSGTSIVDPTTENVAVFQGASGNTKFIIAADGNFYADGTLTTYDHEDDMAVISAHNALAEMGGKLDEPPPEYFAALWDLHKKGLVGYVGPRGYKKGERPLDSVTGVVRVLRGERVQGGNREAIYIQVQQEDSRRLRAVEEALGLPVGPLFMDRCNELAAGRNVGRLPAPIQQH